MNIENKNSIDQKIEATLQSLDGLQKPELPLGLEQKIISKVNALPARIYDLRPVVKWAIAVSIVLLAGINILSMIHYQKSSRITTTQSSPVYQEYFSYLNSIN